VTVIEHAHKRVKMFRFNVRSISYIRSVIY